MSEVALVKQPAGSREMAFTNAAMVHRENLLGLTALVSTIETPEQNEVATKAVALLRRGETELESLRVELKKPALEEGRRIDQAFAKFVAPISAEVMRVAKLMGDYVSLLAAKKRDEELARRRDLDELERQRREAMSQVTTHAEREAVQESYDRFAAAVPAPTPIELPKQQSAKPDWEFTVTDPHALYRFDPNCIKLEVKTRELKELLTRNDGKVPGVMAIQINKVNVRPAREEKPLELTGGAA
jgi:hypothetical protein